MEKNIELAKVLMVNEWFTKTHFNDVMFNTNCSNLPIFENIIDMCEQRIVKDEDCGTYKEYKFLDSPSTEECKEQIQILKDFHLI